jgi:hypothetical protein
MEGLGLQIFDKHLSSRFAFLTTAVLAALNLAVMGFIFYKV